MSRLGRLKCEFPSTSLSGLYSSYRSFCTCEIDAHAYVSYCRDGLMQRLMTGDRQRNFSSSSHKSRVGAIIRRLCVLAPRDNVEQSNGTSCGTLVLAGIQWGGTIRRFQVCMACFSLLTSLSSFSIVNSASNHSICEFKQLTAATAPNEAQKIENKLFLT